MHQAVAGLQMGSCLSVKILGLVGIYAALVIEIQIHLSAMFDFLRSSLIRLNGHSVIHKSPVFTSNGHWYRTNP